jgi:hypothetical protein
MAVTTRCNNSHSAESSVKNGDAPVERSAAESSRGGKVISHKLTIAVGHIPFQPPQAVRSSAIEAANKIMAPATTRSIAEMIKDSRAPATNASDCPTSEPNRATPTTLPV